jgi:hypothetical protein
MQSEALLFSEKCTSSAIAVACTIKYARATSAGTELTQSVALPAISATRAMPSQYYTAHEGHGERNGHMSTDFTLFIHGVHLPRASAEFSQGPIDYTYFLSPKFRNSQSGHPSGQGSMPQAHTPF